jgi:sirohydrochlorin cobaltochelatase
MSGSLERNVEAMLAAPFCFGQIAVQKTSKGFELCHRDDQTHDQLETFRDARVAIEIARYDDDGNYRSLKTAPNLRHGWRIELGSVEELKRALDNFYPGRLAVFAAWQRGQLHTTPLRETLDRQSGMYRIAAKISDAQIDHVVADFCRSNGGCLRTILWKRDQSGAIASTKLPKEKFDPTRDQFQLATAAQSSACVKATPDNANRSRIPLLCQEPCNLLVAACRNVVKAG